jgi:hypothetical protein
MNKKLFMVAPFLIFMLLIGMLSSRSSSDVNAQIIITFPFNTPTRTPTPITLGDFVWDDLDKDGRQDAGEPGISGVTVQLWNSTKTQVIDSDVTNGSGNYTVVAPTSGNYRIRVVLPGGWDSFSPKDQAGGNNNLDSDINPSGGDTGFTDVFSIASNVISIINIDAGIILFRTPTATRTPSPINIGNLVWHDLDQDGIQDAGEPGIPGITVQLWDAAKTTLIHSTTTNNSGIYTLVAPFSGDYRVRVVPFPGSSFSDKDQGIDDTKDSDINHIIISPNYQYTDIISIASNVISMTFIDAGLRTVGATSTPTLGIIQTATPSETPTLQFSATPLPDYPNKIFLPFLSKGS